MKPAARTNNAALIKINPAWSLNTYPLNTLYILQTLAVETSNPHGISPAAVTNDPVAKITNPAEVDRPLTVILRKILLPPCRSGWKGDWACC